MNCDICGKEAFLFKVIIEQTTMNVCKECSNFGRVIKEEKPKEKQKPTLPTSETIEVIVPDYAEKIRKARENLNLTQKDFSKLISEKESLIQGIESNNTTPTIKLARKFERFFKIELVKEHREEFKNVKINLKDTSLTIGDLLNIKKD